MKSDKNTTPRGLDSSVLLLFTLFNVFEEKDLLESTLGKLYYHLSPDGLGLRRFLIDNELDEYFGGGVWYITTYWAAEAYLKLGKKDKAKKLLEYRFRFPLPEQIVDTPLIFTEEGKQKWLRISKSENDGIPGPAEPLTWSNSEFLRVSLNVPL
jgi:GH15 family glucan-1,4-alpha-glucosidase